MSALFEELDYRDTPIGALSLRRRRDIDAFGDQLLQQFGRDVLVVKRQRVGSSGNLAQDFKVGVRTDD